MKKKNIAKKKESQTNRTPAFEKKKLVRSEIIKMDPQKFKEQGNEHFKNEDFDEAISCYTKALKFSDRSKNDKDCAIYLKNRSACKLKVEDYEGKKKKKKKQPFSILHLVSNSTLKFQDRKSVV